MSWLKDTHLRDLDDEVVIEATCLKCMHTWLQSPAQLLLKVDHRDITLDEICTHLACTRFGCAHVGVRLSIVRNEDTSGFVGGLP